MHGEGCPTRREPGKRYPFANGDLASTGTRFSGKILVPDEGWIPNYRIERSAGLNGEKVRSLDIRSAPDISDPLASHVCAMCMYFYPVYKGQRLSMWGEFTKALDRRD